VSTVKEIQAVIPKLSREEIGEIRKWIDDYLEDQLELTDDVKTKLDQSRREIAAAAVQTPGRGNIVTHHPTSISREIASSHLFSYFLLA
jgi:hypothetical protein